MMTISKILMIIIILLMKTCNSITPSGEMKIRQKDSIIYVAASTFGGELNDESETTYKKLVKPIGDDDGCSPVIPRLQHNSQFYLLVARGNCSFVDKAIAAETAGAKGIVIYNSIEGIYQGNNFASSSDYECNNGQSYIPTNELVYPVYSDEMISKIPTECSQNSKCSSGYCVLTNTTNENGTLACCAWDLYMTMGSSSDETVQPSIPAVFARMQDADTLSSLPELDALTLDVSIFQRSTPIIDFSSVLIWMIAVCTVAIGSSRAAEDDKITTLLTKDGYGSRRSSISEINQRIPPPQIPLSTASIVEPRSGFISSRSNSMDSRDFESVKGEHNPNSLDITPLHAVAFVIVSSGFLLLLYFVDLYFFVTIMYLGSAALATNLIFFYPAIKKLGRKIHAYIAGIKNETYNEYMSLGQAHFDIPFMLGQILSTGLSVLWYFFKDSNWVWLIQDFMGISVCIMFLAAIRLPNLKVATILLGLAFFYDVFFVFISPYFFDSSVMVEVATGPTTAHSDENYCEKYPTDESCQTTQLPMLLVVPTFSSYESSESMLGLGDIVLPGLLLVWCARLDMRRYGSLSSESASKGYLPMALLGYALGLLVANLAVDYFQAGQPALLYIVPLTLGPVLYRSYNSKSLRDLWRSLPALKLIALPVDIEETEALLQRPDVVETVASWKNEVDVVVLANSSRDSRDSRDEINNSSDTPFTDRDKELTSGGRTNNKNNNYGLI